MGRKFTSLGFAPVGVLVLLFLAGGLALAVTRVTDLRTVLNLPKAAEQKQSCGFVGKWKVQDVATVDYKTPVEYELVLRAVNKTQITGTAHDTDHNSLKNEKEYTGTVIGEKLTGRWRQRSVTYPEWGWNSEGPFRLELDSNCNSFTGFRKMDKPNPGTAPLRGERQEPLPSSRRICSVSFSRPLVTVGEVVTITATASGDRRANEAMRLWLEKTNGNRITPLPAWGAERNYLPDGGKYHYALSSCNTTNTKPCTVSADITISAGTYSVHCDIIGSTSPEGVAADKDKCTGNPFCTINGGTQACSGWKSCGDRDKASLTVR